jgi:hypothetical protein
LIARLKFAATVGIVILGTAQIYAQVPPKFPSKIKSVTAKLYYSGSGTFSANILDKPALALWNTIIGEGGSGGASEATLIEVEVDGDGRGNVIHKERLTITVQAKGKPAITRHTAPLYFDENGKHFEAVWLYDSGCLPVTITAQLDNQPEIHKKIDFECGE